MAHFPKILDWLCNWSHGKEHQPAFDHFTWVHVFDLESKICVGSLLCFHKQIAQLMHTLREDANSFSLPYPHCDPCKLLIH